MKTRQAGQVQSKLVILLYGATFSGKTTLGLELAYLKRPDGKPFRVAVVDAEGGGVDDALNKLEDNGIDVRNIHVFYTQSLQELLNLVDKIKNRETLYECDDEGNETDIPMTDADGNEFFPDAIFIDGTTIFRLTSEQGLLELSKKRNTIKADKDGLIGAERFVKVQGADLEFKDYKKLNYLGQNLVLELMAVGINVVLTAREKDETKQEKNSKGEVVSVSTGEKVYDSFKGIDYNVKTVLHLYLDEETGQICAKVKKDRTGVHKPGEIIEDPTLIDWQSVIDRNAKRKEFILKNDLDKAVDIEQEMYEKEAMELHNAITGKTYEGEMLEKTEDIDALRKMVYEAKAKLSSESKSKVKAMLDKEQLPTAYKNVNDADVLHKVLDIFNSVL